MLTEKEVKFLKQELSSAKNPLFIYDGDADGLASFLLLYRINREGRGHVLKASPKVDINMLRKVNEYNSDKIFILDIPKVEREFVDKAKRPIFWIDHHHPINLKNVHYYNPRLKDPDAYIPTSRMAYQISQNDLWIATVGCLADWHLPDFIEKFSKQYPNLLPKVKDLKDAVYKQKVGKLVKLFFFLLKGKHHDVTKSIKILTRIKSPEEILQQTTSQGNFLYKRFQKINQMYEEMLKEAKKSVTKEKVVVFYYTEKQWSFTTNLANELTVLYPKKVIIVCRKRSGQMKCSLRAQKEILPAVEKALQGVEGYGGGHKNACGAVIHEDDWDQFLNKFTEGVK